MILANLVGGLNGSIGSVASAQTAGTRSSKPSVDEPHNETYSADLLSDRRYAKRRRATLEMWRNRDAAQEQVQAAALHRDPEAASRAAWILRQWQRGVLPDTPVRISRDLQFSNLPDMVDGLLDRGQFQAARVAIEESFGTPNETMIRRRVGWRLQEKFPLYARSAVISESVEPLFHLIELVADSHQLLLCRLRMMKFMNLPIDEDQLLPAAASQWSEAKRVNAKITLLAWLGRIDEVIEIARDRNDLETEFRCLMVMEKWSDALELAHQQAVSTENGARAKLFWWCETLNAASRCGEEQRADEAIDFLVDTTKHPAQSPMSAEPAWKCLAVHGMLETAIDQGMANRPALERASLWRLCDRPVKSLAVLGISVDQIDRQIHQWLTQAIEEQSQSNGTKAVESVKRLIFVMGTLVSVGDHDTAWLIASRLNEIEPKVKKSHRRLPYRVVDDVFDELTKMGADSLVTRLAVIGAKRTISPQNQKAVAETLDDVDFNTFSSLFTEMAKLFPRWSVTRRFQATVELAKGQLPNEFDPHHDLNLLYSRLSLPNPRASLRRQQGLTVSRRTGKLNMEMTDLFSKHGREDLATNCLRDLMVSGNQDAAMTVAQRAVDSGSLDQAANFYSNVLTRLALPTGPGSGYGAPVNADLYGRAFLGLWDIVKRHGDENENQEMRRQLELMICGPSSRFNQMIAMELADRGEHKWARSILKPMLPTSLIGISIDNTNGSSQAIASERRADNIYRAAAAFASTFKLTEPSLTVDWLRIAAEQIVFSTSWRDNAYIVVPIRVLAHQIEAAIDRGDVDQVNRCVDELLVFQPQSIALPERLIPLMNEAGLHEPANRLLKKIVENGRQHALDFPLDATNCNNTAWLAAKNDHRLDLALALSQQAVRTEPESVIFRDTLAEVLFHVQREQEALQIEQHCLLEKFDMWHLHEQIRRFSKPTAAQALVED